MTANTPNPYRSGFFAGRPAPQGSKKLVRHGRMIESSKYVAPWRKRIAAAAALQQPEMLPRAPVVADLQFVLPRPVQTPKRAPTPPAVKRNGDLDKLVRAVFDALTGIWIEDDCLIVELHATKRIAELGERPGVHVRLEIQQPNNPVTVELLP